MQYELEYLTDFRAVQLLSRVFSIRTHARINPSIISDRVARGQLVDFIIVPEIHRFLARG